MEPELNSSTQSVNTICEDELDVTNLITELDGLDIKKEEPFNDATIVIFSLDTTDRNTNINEILMIAAACRGNNGEINKFQVYMKPERYGIAPCTTVNKGYKMGINGTLLLFNNEVDARPQREGLELFLEFLRFQSGGTRSVLLAAHGCDKVRRPVLLRHMAQYNLLPGCQELVMGFIDTVPVFKEILQGRVGDPADNDKNFSLKNLARTYLSLNILHPRADVAVQTLLSLINCPAINRQINAYAMLRVYANIFNFDAYILLIDLKHDFQTATGQNQVSIIILKKIAKAGISSARLQTEYRDNNGDVSNLLQGVTKNRDVIQMIHARLLAISNAN